MAPKSKVVKTETKKGRADKSEAKQPTLPEPEAVVKVDDSGLPGRKDLSSFVTGLKYKSKNPNDPNQTQAQKLLDHYHSLDDPDKRSLVKKYQEQGGIKNLNWTTKFFEESTSASSSTTGREQGYYNVAEIFKLNGFDYSVIEEKERKPMLDHFLKESSQYITPDKDHTAKQEVPGLITEVTFRARHEHFLWKNTTLRAPAIIPNFTQCCTWHIKAHLNFTKQCNCHEK